MTILSAFRDRLSGHDASAQSKTASDPQGDPGGDAPLPFAGFDRLNDRQVMDGLSDHSQVELEAADSYERSHKNRLPVLDKLRYMRGREPLPGYDALSVEEIVAALKEADQTTIKKVRGYERKFANRPDVLEEVVRLHHHRRQATEPPEHAAPETPPPSAPSGAPSTQPPSPPPSSYQPMSPTSAFRAPVDGSEMNGRP